MSGFPRSDCRFESRVLWSVSDEPKLIDRRGEVGFGAANALNGGRTGRSRTGPGRSHRSGGPDPDSATEPTSSGHSVCAPQTVEREKQHEREPAGREASRGPRKPTYRPRIETLEIRITPAVYTWTGLDGNLWSDPANWTGDAAPAPGTGADLVFPASLTNNSSYTTANDFPAGSTFGSVTIESAGYKLIGDARSAWSTRSTRASRRGPRPTTSPRRSARASSPSTTPAPSSTSAAPSPARPPWTRPARGRSTSPARP